MSAPQSSKKQPIPFGKYLLLDRINIGGMAEVWRGKTFGANDFERLVAIKRILPNIAEDEEFITMFIDEAKITVQLTHANIAQIYELGHISTSYFIAMEYIAGKDMRAIFDRCRKKSEPAPISLTCYVISKACEGLDYAHRKKDGMGRDLSIVHRDISPQNILISYEGEVKVIDFGIAKAAGKASQTQAGILKGKFGYMSPEQIRGLPLDRRSDVFACGVCLYEMLTGERLFVGDSDFSVLEKVRKAEVLPPSTYNRRIPEALEKIVLKALAKDVDDRYQYANEISDDLQRFLITSDSIFSRRDLMQYMKSTFAEEVERERARISEYLQIKAPPGMLAAVEAGYGPSAFPPPTPAADSQSSVTLLPSMVAPPAPPMQGSSRSGPGAVVSLGSSPQVPTANARRNSVGGGVPRLSAVAPVVPAPQDTDLSTQLVERNAQKTGSNPNLDLGAEPSTDGGYRTAPNLAITPSGSNPAARPGDPISSPTLAAVPNAMRRGEARDGLHAVLDMPTHPGLPSYVAGGRGRLIAAVLGAAVLGIGAAAALALLREVPTGLILIEIPAEARGKARVNINGDDVRDADGKPPRDWPLLRKVRAGKGIVLITADDYETFRQQVTVAEGQDVTTVTAKLERRLKLVQLVLVPDPQAAAIELDGKEVKAAGVKSTWVGEVPLGSEHVVAARLPGYNPFEKKLLAGDLTAALTVSVKLEPVQCPVSVTSEPVGASIFVGETAMGLTPNTVRVAFGVGEIVLKKHCYDDVKLALTLPTEPKDPIPLAGKLTRQPNCN